MGMRSWCFECGQSPFHGWGNYCNECLAKQARHKELVKATKTTVDSFCRETIKNGGFYFEGKNYKVVLGKQ